MSPTTTGVATERQQQNFSENYCPTEMKEN